MNIENRDKLVDKSFEIVGVHVAKASYVTLKAPSRWNVYLCTIPTAWVLIYVFYANG